MNSYRHVIIHYHLFKNAGTTIAAALQRHFGERFATVEATQPGARFNSQNMLTFLREHPTVAALSSHTLWPPLPEADGMCFHEIVILRDPLDRIRSMYDFYRRSEPTAHRLAPLAKQEPIQSFLRCVIRDYPYVVNNAQLRMLVANGTRKPRRNDLETALTFLRNVTVIGTVEHYNQCLATGEHELRKTFPGLELSYFPKNVSQRAGTLQVRLAQLEAECGTALYSELKSLNELDMELVALASRETLRRFHAMPDAERILTHFEKRVWWSVHMQYCRERLGRFQNFFWRRKEQLSRAKLALAEWAQRRTAT
jgi:hypothetical protein